MDEYTLEIERGYSVICDYCIDFIKPKIEPPYIDIGCNAGWLLSEVAGGHGVELSKPLAEIAAHKGLTIFNCDATFIPVDDGKYRTVILISVLEQCYNWKDVLKEAIRVSNNKVIGINPIPDMSQWGRIGGWVNSVIPPYYLIKSFEQYRVTVEKLDHAKYYFEIIK